VIGHVDVPAEALSFDLRGFSFGVKQTGTIGTGGGGGAGKAEFADVTLVKSLDTATPNLLVLTASGQHIPQATVSLYAPGTATVIATYALTDVLVSSLATNANGGAGDVPLDTVTLNYGRILQTVSVDGTTTHGGWDLQAGKKL
jgi:type VI secretion system secreted protein Hcp